LLTHFSISSTSRTNSSTRRSPKISTDSLGEGLVVFDGVWPEVAIRLALKRESITEARNLDARDALLDLSEEFVCFLASSGLGEERF